jgi:hypothetical protein
MEGFYLDLTQKTRQRGNHNNDENKRSAREIRLVGLASSLSTKALLHNINLPFDFLAEPLNPRAKWSNSRSMHSMPAGSPWLCVVVPQRKLRDDTIWRFHLLLELHLDFEDWAWKPSSLWVWGTIHQNSWRPISAMHPPQSRHVLLSSSTIRSISPLVPFVWLGQHGLLHLYMCTISHEICCTIP